MLIIAAPSLAGEMLTDVTCFNPSEVVRLTFGLKARSYHLVSIQVGLPDGVSLSEIWFSGASEQSQEYHRPTKFSTCSPTMLEHDI